MLGAISIANIVLGFGREATIAYFFGTSPELDAFLVALALPNLLVVNIAAISVSVVLPVYVGYREAGETARASALVNRWFWFSGSVIAGLCVALFLSSELLMTAMATGFTEHQRAQAAGWLRWLLPYVWLLSMIGVFKSVLNSNDRFAGPAMASPLVSLCVMLACALGAQRLGAGVLSAGYGAGGFLAFFWLWTSSRKYEPQVPSWRGRRPTVSLPVAAGGAMVLSSVAMQVDVIIDRAFASGLQEGSISAYNYARMLNAIPTAVVTSVLATVLFPVLARMTAAGEWRGALRTVQRWSTALFLAGLGPVLLLIMFREEAVSIVFQRGAFDSAAVAMTAEVLAVLPFMMVITAISSLFTQLLLAQMRARVVAFLAVMAICTKIGLNFVFVERFGLPGLALATVVASLLATIARVFTAVRYAHSRSG